MPTTKYDVATAALLMIGSAPVTSFDENGTAEEIAAAALYQTTLDSWLEMHPWRFATKQTLLSRDANAPSARWSASYAVPTGCRAVQALEDAYGNEIPFDRFEDKIYCDASSTTAVYAIHTYEPAVTKWPGYFTLLIQLALASTWAITLAGKIDLSESLEKKLDYQFRLAKSRDSQQQTTRKLRTTGRGSILEARRA